MVLSKLKKSAKEINAKSVILTFFPHPRMVLQQDNSIKLINTIEEKKELINSFDIDCLIIHPFDLEFSRLTAEEFVQKILVEKLNISKIIIGYDHRFGRNRTATIEDLIKFGKKYNFEVEQITAKEIDEISISSTKIRNALLQGDIFTANQYLGHYFSLNGKVVEGNKIGRTIGFPTANIFLEEDYKLIPQNGVYLTIVFLEDEFYFGMTNIGYNPTIPNEEIKIETHVLDFNRSIYSKRIQLFFLDRMRNEVKFNSLQELKEQLLVDKERSITRIENEFKSFDFSILKKFSN